MVARAERLLDGSFAAGKQSCKQNSRFNLGAGHRHLVFNALKATAMNAKWRKVASSAADFCAHLAERSHYTIHGTARKGFISMQSAIKIVASQNAGKHAHGRT